MLPKVKSWRDTGETLCRKNHQEEAKLWLLHTPSLCIASPLHGKWRNQEGSHATRCQFLLARETQTTRWAKQPAVLPQTTLGQISIAPGQTNPHQWKKEKKNWIINNNKKRHMAKREGHPEPWRGGREIPHGTVNKQAGWRRQELRHPPSNLGAGKLVKVAVWGKHHWRGGKRQFPREL
jgi:hypothetical protein